MKKLILIAGLIMTIQGNIKAQQGKQFGATTYITSDKNADLQERHVFSGFNNLPGSHGPERNADFYFHRSKSQRTVGWVTLGGGLLLSGIGFLLMNGDVTSNSGNDNTAGVLFIAGATSGIVSIPFMIMASANRHKAKLLMANQKTGFGAPSNISKYITGITMTIPIGK